MIYKLILNNKLFNWYIMSIVEGSKENPLPDPTNKKLRIKGAWYLHKLGLRFWDGKKINKPKENRPPKKNRTPKSSTRKVKPVEVKRRP